MAAHLSGRRTFSDFGKALRQERQERQESSLGALGVLSGLCVRFFLCAFAPSRLGVSLLLLRHHLGLPPQAVEEVHRFQVALQDVGQVVVEDALDLCLLYTSRCV